MRPWASTMHAQPPPQRPRPAILAARAPYMYTREACCAACAPCAISRVHRGCGHAVIGRRGHYRPRRPLPCAEGCLHVAAHRPPDVSMQQRGAVLTCTWAGSPRSMSHARCGGGLGCRSVVAAVDPILRNVKPPIFLSLKTHRLKFGSRAPEVVAMRTFSVSPRRVVLHARVRFVGDDLQAVIVAGMPTGRVFAGARHSHPLGRGESGLMRCGVRGRYMVSGRSCWAHHDLRGSADWEQV